MDNNVKSFLQAIRHEAVKLYREYDASNRVSFQYEALHTAEDGDPCMVTEYQYDGLSNRVTKMREYVGVWDSVTMDIP